MMIKQVAKSLTDLSKIPNYQITFQRINPTTSSSRLLTSTSSTTPIIPRIRTVYPHPIVPPHPETVRLVNSTEFWAKNLAMRSIVDEQTRHYLDTVDKNHIWDVPCLYTSFSCDPNCRYETLFELNKNVMFVQFVDDLTYFDQQSLIGEEVFDYLTKFIKDPGLVHDPADDLKRKYFVNMLGHSVNGLRNGGCSPNQIRRLLKAYELFIQHVKKQPPELDWNNYWRIKHENALIQCVSIPAEAVLGLDDLPDEFLDDPGVRSAMKFAWQIITATNDLVSWLRERDTVEAPLNYISFLMKQGELDEQSAVDRCCEQLGSFNRQWVVATQEALRSPIVRQHRQLDIYLKHILPRYTYGNVQAYELFSRNRLDDKKINYYEDNWWTCDDLFVNDSDPNKGEENYEQYLKKYEHLGQDLDFL